MAYIEKLGVPNARRIVEEDRYSMKEVLEPEKYADCYLFDKGEKLLVSVFDKDNNVKGYFFTDFALYNILPNNIHEDFHPIIQEELLTGYNVNAINVYLNFLFECVENFQDEYIKDYTSYRNSCIQKLEEAKKVLDSNDQTQYDEEISTIAKQIQAISKELPAYCKKPSLYADEIINQNKLYIEAIQRVKEDLEKSDPSKI